MKTEEAEILALIEELTVSELCLAEELRNFGIALSEAAPFRIELPRDREAQPMHVQPGIALRDQDRQHDERGEEHYDVAR